MEYSLLILIIPFVLFIFLGLLGKYLQPKVAGAIGTIGMGATAFLAYSVAYNYFIRGLGKVGPSFQAISPIHFEWLKFTDKLHIDLGILLDPISVLMLVVITTVSFMVHIYSLGYMHGEKGFQRYYALLSLFSVSMLGLVIATNIFQMYIFWELVGVSSYSLIGFYYRKPSAIAASKKAFIVTRFADLGFLIGILVLSYYTGTFDFASLTSNHAQLVLSSTAGCTFAGVSVASWALALIFIGGAGKSAMFPLHIWLPDAMEGPTPVSALIHAATMVVAGVFLVARLFPVYYFVTPVVLKLIAYIGGFTALFAAVVALTQTDIKRVLAFSTISQIAYMMVGLGVSKYGGQEGLGYMASMFHMYTHAFFKALLFLCAGSVIHCIGSNEMDKMGRLHKYMPVTSITFLIACLAISGIPPFSGFFSKDEIITACYENNRLLFWTLWFVAGLTSFYMFRIYFGIFWGKEKKYPENHRPHESPLTMTFPLMFLALLSVISGFTPFPKYISSDNTPFLNHMNLSTASFSVLIGLVGIIAAFFLYAGGGEVPAKIAHSFGQFYTAAHRKFYMDEIWLFVTKSVIFKRICRPIAWIDRHVVDGFMNGLAATTQKVSVSIRGLQSGQVQFYVWIYILGALFITTLVLVF